LGKIVSNVGWLVGWLMEDVCLHLRVDWYFMVLMQLMVW